MTGKEFQEAQAKLGWTGGDAAHQLGVSAKTIDNWRHGRTIVPKAVAMLMPFLVKEKEINSKRS